MIAHWKKTNFTFLYKVSKLLSRALLANNKLVSVYFAAKFARQILQSWFGIRIDKWLIIKDMNEFGCSHGKVEAGKYNLIRCTHNEKFSQFMLVSA